MAQEIGLVFQHEFGSRDRLVKLQDLTCGGVNNSSGAAGADFGCAITDIRVMAMTGRMNIAHDCSEEPQELAA